MDDAEFERMMRRFFEDPSFRLRMKEEVRSIREMIRAVANELGIDPQKDVVYVTAFMTLASAMTTADIQKSSERLEGLSKTLISETKSLRLVAIVVGALTVVLTLALLFRPLF